MRATILVILTVFAAGNSLRADVRLLPLVSDAFVSVDWDRGAWGISPNWNYAAVGRIQYGGGDGEDRGLMEFSLSPMTAPPQAATLRIWQFDAHEQNHPAVGLYVYPGDGNVSISDFSAAATRITNVIYPFGYNYGHAVPFDVDVTTALALAYQQGWSYLGIRLQAENITREEFVYAAEGSGPVAGGTPPVLSVDVVPEPFTLALLALGGLAIIRRRRASA